MTTSISDRRRAITAFVAALMLAGTACGADSVATATGVGGDEAFCQAVADLNAVTPPGGPADPAPEQIADFVATIRPHVDAMAAQAPRQVAAAVLQVSEGVARLDAGDMSVLGAPEINEAFAAIEAEVRTACDVTAVDLTATDFAFDRPAEPIRAGLVSLQLTNDGEQPHVLLLSRAPDEHPDGDVAFVTDLLSAVTEVEAGGSPDAIAVFEPYIVEGNGVFAGPGDTGTMTRDLEAGTYVYYCPIPVDFSDPGSQTHLELGMLGRITLEA